MSKLLSVTDCAELYGVARSTIHAAIKRGALKAVRVGNAWVIPEEACAGYHPIRDPREKGKAGMAARWRGATMGASEEEVADADD